MIKRVAKRNQRQRKKLRVDEYRQWEFFVKFSYEEGRSALDIDLSILDDLYCIAEKWNCWMMGFIGSSEADMSFHNNLFLQDGIQCQKEIADWLVEQDGISNVRVGFSEEKQ